MEFVRWRQLMPVKICVAWGLACIASVVPRPVSHESHSMVKPHIHGIAVY